MPNPGHNSACCIESFSPTDVDFEGFDMDQWVAIDFNETNPTPGAMCFGGVVNIKSPDNVCTIFFPGASFAIR